ncbi:MAG TPA: hypothetical protein VNO55_10280 [Polyangia bacterium]|nr:hypothetical protein [Polyangia bacterium]
MFWGALLAPACGGSSGATAVVDAGADAPAAGDDAPPAGDDAMTAEVAEEAAADLPVELPPPPQPYDRPTYMDLSETGLYADFAGKTLSDGVTAFEPTHKLWSDGATKRRWIKLPPGTQIDTSDMDHWVFPVGTKFFKEFSMNGVLLETRLVERYGVGPDDYWFGAFVWNADQTDALFVVNGQDNINGTPHDAPSQKNCGACHRGDIGRVLGFSAIQLSRPDNPPTLKSLAAAGTLSNPPAGGADFPVPGDDLTARALGYLHANCGHCHNINGTSWPDTQMVLRLSVAERAAKTSELYGSVVGKMLQYFPGGPITLRVSPGHPDDSALIARMSSRTSKIQMPPLATEIVDPDGLTLIRDWITSLAP